MILPFKTKNWPLELIAIMLMFFIVNLTVYFIGYNGIYYTIACQLINIVGMGILFLVAKSHLNSLRQNSGSSWVDVLKKKISMTDFFFIILVILLNNISIVLMPKIEFTSIFNTIGFKDFTVSHLSNLERSIFGIVIFFSMIFAVFTEELYFRSYLFEIQYKTFKNYTWLINGSVWSFYHIFTFTNFILILPGCLLIAYAYQKRRNIWVTFIAHLVNNLLILFARFATFTP